MLGHGIVIWLIKVTAHFAHIFNCDYTQCDMPTANAAGHCNLLNFLLSQLVSCQLLLPQALELLYKFWQPSDIWGCYSTLLTLSMDTADTSASNDKNQKFVIVKIIFLDIHTMNIECRYSEHHILGIFIIIIQLTWNWATWSVLVSLMISPGVFCLLVCSFFFLFSLTYYGAFCLYVATKTFCIPIVCPQLDVIFSSFTISVFVS
jgi:hypothetical protein